MSAERLVTVLNPTSSAARLRNTPVTVVVPTRNEEKNIPVLAERLGKVLSPDAQVIFADVSSDNTPEIIEKEFAKYPFETHVFTPPFRGGLASEVAQSFEIADRPNILIIDSDGQHPPAMISVMLHEAMRTGPDFVLASRYIAGGGRDGLNSPFRKAASAGSALAAKVLFPGELGGISDPMSGFFMFKRSLLTENIKLDPIGWKILVELLVKTQWETAVEIPYKFQSRTAGTSKADFKQGYYFGLHLIRLLQWKMQNQVAQLTSPEQYSAQP